MKIMICTIKLDDYMNLQEYFKSRANIQNDEVYSDLLDIFNDPLDDEFFIEGIPFAILEKTEPVQGYSKEEIKDFLDWAKNVKCPEETIKLDQCTTIKDSKLFIKSSIATIKANGHKRIYQPYIDSFRKYKQLITSQNGPDKSNR